MSLPLSTGHLLVVDYTASTPERTESLQWIFDGGVLSPAAISRIRLQTSELESYRFVRLDELMLAFVPRLARRLQCALEALAAGETWYTEHQIRF